MVKKNNSITMQAQGQGQNHKSMEAAIYKILINFLYFLKSNKIPSFITKCTFFVSPANHGGHIWIMSRSSSSSSELSTL